MQRGPGRLPPTDVPKTTVAASASLAESSHLSLRLWTQEPLALWVGRARGRTLRTDVYWGDELRGREQVPVNTRLQFGFVLTQS